MVDVDVQYSPLTNVMPIRRLGLDRPGATGSFVMAWVSVPSLTVSLDLQHYTLLGADGGELRVRFESGDGSFTADIRGDSDGMVVDYPGDRSKTRLSDRVRAFSRARRREGRTPRSSRAGRRRCREPPLRA